MYLHTNGWLEISIPMDSASVNKRTKDKIQDYRAGILQDYKFSSLRLNYLYKTIDFLRNYGKVYIVRLPIHPKMMEIENEFMPDFNDIIKDIIPLTSGYMDMTVHNQAYRYIDGNHLYKESGKLVSEKIATWIKNGGEGKMNKSTSERRTAYFKNK